MRILTAVVISLLATSVWSQDFEETLRLAQDGDASAQYSLGVMYHDGDGVTENASAAVKWYRKAAEQGDTRAQFWLGLMYDDGEGITQNYRRAHMWWNIARLQGDQRAQQGIRRVEDLMTPDDVSAAQKMATRCFESNYTDCD